MNERFGNGAGVLCKVCGDRASGKHYGVPSCDGCRGFFKRSIRRNLEYVCKEGGKCVVDVSRRNQCQACRFAKCIEANMRREAVQHERAPKISGVSTSSQNLNYAANIYGTRHNDFQFPMHFSPPMSFSLDHYYPLPTPLPYYPHLAESLNLKLNHSTVYKPNLLTASSYDVEIGKMLTNNFLSRVPMTETKCDKNTKEKENEVTSSEEIPAGDSIRLKSTQSLYDSATKLLFLSIRWAKSIPSFNSLPLNEQMKLLNQSWAELFVIAAAQWGLAINDEKSSPFLKLFQSVVKHFTILKIDHFEAACLKALILFRNDEDQAHQVSLLQNQTLCLLIEKCGSLRFGHLLLLLPQIRTVGNIQSLQENLFKHSVGEIFIEKILEDL